MRHLDIASSWGNASASERRAAREGAAQCRRRSGDLRRESQARREAAWEIRSLRSETLAAADERREAPAPDSLPRDDFAAFVAVRALLGELEAREAAEATEVGRAALRRERLIARIEADALGRRLRDGDGL